MSPAARRWRRVHPHTPAYPHLLNGVDDPPPLHVLGELAPDAAMLAIVGARMSTPYGDDVAYEMAAGLARAGLVVVSGLARGIDAAAHRGALDAGGRTIAVMGTGPGMVYPPEHRELALRISQSGALVTQFDTGTKPFPGNFPKRNEVLSGLCIGVVVVEARRRSGAMLTAGSAGHQGRAVMAVPGSVFSGASRGCHDLIRDGARLVTSVDDILGELNSETLSLGLTRAPVVASAEPPGFGDLRDDVLAMLRTRPATLDELAGRLRRSARDVAVAVATLRVDGMVALRDGAYSMVRKRVAPAGLAAREAGTRE